MPSVPAPSVAVPVDELPPPGELRARKTRDRRAADEGLGYISAIPVRQFKRSSNAAPTCEVPNHWVGSKSLRLPKGPPGPGYTHIQRARTVSVVRACPTRWLRDPPSAPPCGLRPSPLTTTASNLIHSWPPPAMRDRHDHSRTYPPGPWSQTLPWCGRWLRPNRWGQPRTCAESRHRPPRRECPIGSS